MSKRLTFREFSALLEARKMPPQVLADYVDFDDDSAIPKIVFRADALLDEPPDDYDVDWEVYLYDREMRAAQLEVDDALSAVERINVVAEGDSWFNLPAFLRPPAIADQLAKRSHLRVRNIGYWGDTLEEMLDTKEYLDEIEAETRYFLLSAGGNDLQAGLESGEAIHEYDPARPHDEYLTDAGAALLESIRDDYAALIGEVRGRFPYVEILTHAYDYPRPLVGTGKYIGQYLREQGIPDDEMQPIIEPIIDELNARIEDASSSASLTTYLDCRGVTLPYVWYDDMHPHREGFRALADVFDESMD